MHYIVHGRVQGVFYRASTREQALRMGLSGWVKNLANGGVEVLACGDEEQLQQFGQWLWQGPEYAHVTHVQANAHTLECLTSGQFEIHS